MPNSQPHSPFHQQERSPFIQRIAGSLALRVLLVCSVLIIIPLLANTLYMYVQDYRSKMGDLFLTLYVIGREKAMLLEEIMQSTQSELRMLELSFDLDKQLTSALNKKFTKIASKDNFSFIAYLSINANGQLVCTQASDAAMIGRTDLFPGELLHTMKYGRHQFTASNPLTHQQDFYFAKVIPSEGASRSRGILILGIPMEQLISTLAPLKEPPYTYRLSLISDHGDVYSNSPEEIPLSHVHVFSFSGTWNGILKQLEQFKKEIGILEFLHNRYHRIGLKMPVPNSDFSLVVDVSEKAIFEVSSDNVLLGLSSLLLMILVLGGVGTVLVTRRIARPLKALNHEMEKIGEGDLNAHYVKDPMGFEINVLGHNFNCMIASLKQHIEEAKNERVRSETLAQELKIGHEIQKTIFPKQVPELPGLDIGAGFLSAKEVAGDFYDLFVKKENGQLMMAIADAAGKGISACLYALEVRSMLRSFEASYNDLSKTVESTNDLFCLDTGDSGVFVTAWVGVYDPDSRKLNYSSCGHPPAILRRKDGRLEELGTHGMALGVEPFQEVQARTIQLVSGDILILYTDGITEAHNPKNELFGKQRLMDVIDKNANRSAQELVHKIFEEVASFAQEAAQHDDLTLLIARVRD